MVSTAKKLLGLGYSVVPVNVSTKQSNVAWKKYQTTLPTEAEVSGWFSAWNNSIALICGKVSKGLQIIDVDSKYDLSGDLLDRYKESVELMVPGLFERLVLQKTPSGGYHLLYCCENIARNQKLAQRATLEKERDHKNDKTRVLLETRGEGGYFLTSPSEGYELLHLGYEDIPNLSPEDQSCLFEAAKTLNEYALESNSNKTGGLTPFDAFDEQIGEGVIQLMEKHGWKSFPGTQSNTYMLTRPGKDKGISATFNVIPNRLYVFSSSTIFDPEKSIKPSAIYAFLEHNADFSEAAGALSSMGYGDKEHKVNLKNIDGIMRVGDFREDFLENIKTVNITPGYDIGFENMHKLYRAEKGQFTTITGIPSHGKSEFTDSMLVNLARKYQWNIVYYSPENYPHRIHLKKLIEKYTLTPLGLLSQNPEALERAINWVHNHFYFVDGGLDGVRMSDITSITQKLITLNKIDAIVIDPWNELEDMRPKHLSESEYIGRSLKQFRHFCRHTNTAGYIVAHPTKMPKKETKSNFTDSEKILNQYAVPTLYNISGSANWYNKSDNGIVVYRNFETGDTEVYVQKIKYREYGKPGKATFEFKAETGTLTPKTKEDDYRPRHFADEF